MTEERGWNPLARGASETCSYPCGNPDHEHRYTEGRKTVWDLLEEHDASVDETAALYSWSLNYDAGKGPFAVFLDLIGWSMDNLGENINGTLPAPYGYVEVDYLGKALREYALNPHTVSEFVDRLMEAESE